MRNDNFPFTTTIQRDKFLTMKFVEGNYDISDHGAMSLQIKMEAEFPGITRYVEILDGEKGRNISDIIKDFYHIK